MLAIMKRQGGAILIAVLALVGLANATYIYQSDIQGAPLICDIGSLSSGCNIVATSEYAYFLGVPVALFGAFFFGIVFILAVIDIFVGDSMLRRSLRWISVVGVLVSIYLTFIQIFILQASCMYCFSSSTISLLIFLASFFLL
jgi:uncharacterized membrane protein